jgi:hypothetical protein
MLADNEFTEILAKLAAVRAAESVKEDSIEQPPTKTPELSTDH